MLAIAQTWHTSDFWQQPFSLSFPFASRDFPMLQAMTIMNPKEASNAVCLVLYSSTSLKEEEKIRKANLRLVTSDRMKTTMSCGVAFFQD